MTVSAGYVASSDSTCANEADVVTESPSKPKEEVNDGTELGMKEWHDEMAERVKQVNVSFFSKVGNGKSSSANTLLQAWGYEGPPFEARRQRGSVTFEIQTIEQEFKYASQPQKDVSANENAEVEPPKDGELPQDAAPCDDDVSTDNPSEEEKQLVTLRVTDQPGLMDASGRVADAEHLRGTALSGEHQDGYHVIFVVQKITDRLDATEQIILRALKKFYGDAVVPHIVLLLTHSDVLDDAEEIDRMVVEAQADVEKELDAKFSATVAINNHVSKADAAGRDRARAGKDMVQAIHSVVCKMNEPFKPPEVELDAIIGYVDEEIERNPNLKKESIMSAVLRFIPVIGKKDLCNIL
jgi:predicted GTPase